MLSVVIIAVLLTILAADIARVQSNKSLNVTITSDPPLNDTLCVNETVALKCQVSGATQPFVWWSSMNVNVSEKTHKLIVIATPTTTEYYCNAFDNVTKISGQDSVNVKGIGLPPVLHRINFEVLVEVHEGTSLNLTVAVSTNIPLIAEIAWSRLVDPLPITAIVNNFDVGGKYYTSLGLFNLSFADDSGNYSVTAANMCKNTSLLTYIDVIGPKKCPSVDPAPELLKGCVDSATVEGITFVFSCSFEALFTDFVSFTDNYWLINMPNHKEIKVDGTSTYSNYSVKVIEDCFLINETCCRVTSKLKLEYPTSALDNSKVTCIAGLPFYESSSTNSSAHFNVFVRPELEILSTNVTIFSNSSAKLQCHFIASAFKYLTVTEWLKNGLKLHDNSKYQIGVKQDTHRANSLFSMLTILSISESDEASYECRCYYNITTLNALHSHESSFEAKGGIDLEIKVSGSGSESIVVVIIIGATFLAIIFGFVVVCYVIHRVKRGNGYASIDNTNNGEDHINTTNNGENQRTQYTNSLQSFAPDLNKVSVLTILPELQACGLVTQEESDELTLPSQTDTVKKQILRNILLKLDESGVEKFLVCLQNTAADYKPHNELLEDIRRRRAAAINDQS